MSVKPARPWKTKMGREEEQATSTLRERCDARDVGFKVAACPDGTWRGVLFELKAGGRVLALSKAARLELVHAMRNVVKREWPRARGRPARQLAKAA